jgi:hypothetical protein
LNLKKQTLKPGSHISGSRVETKPGTVKLWVTWIQTRKPYIFQVQGLEPGAFKLWVEWIIVVQLPAEAVLNCCSFLVGTVVLRGMIVVMAPPMVSSPEL